MDVDDSCRLPFVSWSSHAGTSFPGQRWRQPELESCSLLADSDCSLDSIILHHVSACEIWTVWIGLGSRPNQWVYIWCSSESLFVCRLCLAPSSDQTIHRYSHSARAYAQLQVASQAIHSILCSRRSEIQAGSHPKGQSVSCCMTLVFKRVRNPLTLIIPLSACC